MHPMWTFGDDQLESDLERERWSAFWVHLIEARMAVTVVLSVALALLPVLGPARVWVALLAFAAGTIANLVVFVRIRKGAQVHLHLAFSDLATVLVVMCFAPQVYAAGVILLVSMTSFYVFWFGGRITQWLLVPTGAALLAIGLLRQPDLWQTMWLAWLATAVLGAVTISRMATVSTELRNRYDDMVNGIDAMVWEASGPVGDAEYVSSRVNDLLGYRPQEFAAFSFLSSHVHPDDLDALIESRRTIAEGGDVEVHYRVRDAWGRQRHLHERVRVATDHDGRIKHRRGILVDETAQWDAERSLRSYADFIEGIPIALAILRLDDPEDPTSLRVVVGNPAAGALVGRSVEDTIGRRLDVLLPSATPFLTRLADVVRLGTSLERPFVRIGDQDEVYALRAMPLPDQCIGLALEDVTKRARLAESLRHKALHDHLTGLPNRARFHERLNNALERATVHGGRTGLLMVDLDRFKDVNDTLGHEYGDRLLIELSRRLSMKLRNCDTIARLGGDEFAILVSDADDDDATLTVAQRLVELCEEPFHIDEFRLQVGASVGAAVAPDDAEDAESLMRQADAAMYQAKESGGGIVAHPNSTSVGGGTRIELLADLKEAVTADELVLHYPPRIDLRSLRPVGVEALVRWQHPRRGILAPGDFIELAEVSGTIAALTRIVTERATTDIATLRAGAPCTVNVNLSARNLHDPLLVDWVVDLLERTGFPPTALCFELTEAQLTEDPSQTLEVLHRLRLLGVRLSIDDFGTGYSSVAYLRELPVDEVKIDAGFISSLGAGDATLVRSVIDLGHNLGLHVVAEGVEDRTSLDALRGLGCDSAQGFHLAPPMPVDDLERYFARLDALAHTVGET